VLLLQYITRSAAVAVNKPIVRHCLE